MGKSFFLFLSFPAERRSFFFFFNDTATTEIYTLSLHDALPISFALLTQPLGKFIHFFGKSVDFPKKLRSEEHTSELQSHSDLVCRLLLEKKKKKILLHINPSVEQQTLLSITLNS